MMRNLKPTITILAVCVLVAAVAGANSLDVNNGAAMGPNSSQFGLEVLLEDVSGTPFQAAWVMADQSKGFNNETTLSGSFFVNPQGVTMSNVAGLNHFQTFVLLDAFGPEAARIKLIFFLQRSADTGHWFITAWHYNELVNNWVFTGTGFLGQYNNAFFSENLVEFEWTAGNPGRLQVWRTVWVNGAPHSSGRNLLMDRQVAGQANAVVNIVAAGVWAGQRAGTFGSLFLDEFVFTR